MAKTKSTTGDVQLGKRKRGTADQSKPIKKPASNTAVNGQKNSQQGNIQSSHASTAASNGATKSKHTGDAFHLQIVTGSYERVLHGISARIPWSRLDEGSQTSNLDGTSSGRTSNGDPTASNGTTSNEDGENVTFTNSFLFAAHASAIRCLAISPPTDSAEKRFLATGSSDERINVYSLSTAPPPPSSANVPSLSITPTAENPRNRSLGSLIHHDRAITSLSFPTKTKLFSAAEDATIAISRTRDWTVLSSIKAPIPKPQGRPSGDTAGPGEIPAGVNDFAIHPSQKLMLSVGRGEKCMRLWNLMTGKKAGVLNFDRDLLTQVGEGKFGSGEGRRVLWDESGENYVVGFERGAVLFGIDSKPKSIVKLQPATKVHQMKTVKLEGSEKSVLVVSTEDGRVCFFDLEDSGEPVESRLPHVPCLAQLGGRSAGISGRVKDFELVQGPHDGQWIVVTASSNGAIRLWTVFEGEIVATSKSIPNQVGRLIATQETTNRITCLGAFVLDGKVSDAPLEDEPTIGAEEQEESEDSDDE